MTALIICVFFIGYLAITVEHNIKIDKLIPALAMMAIMWALVAFGIDGFSSFFNPDLHAMEDVSGLDHDGKLHKVKELLLHHLGLTAEILVFLLGAMTIVEIIDFFNGFSTIKKFVKTKSKSRLLWIFAFLAFILSAIIDNLTATIVLISILQKIVKDREDRLWFAGLIVVAANAGGAWSPIGDVTTTMLWVNDKVSTGNLIKYLFGPSLICMLVPVAIASFLPAFKGNLKNDDTESTEHNTSKHGSRMLSIGLLGIISVPIFKVVTHLPPYVGMMLALAVVGTFAEIYSRSKISISSLDGEHQGHHSPVHASLSKIEMPSVLFFLGILMAVAALETIGELYGFSTWLKDALPMMGTELAGTETSDIVVMFMGVASAVIDNVPLVAASLGMFFVEMDNPLWHFIAYAAGTGGSMLIIGSAAGVVAMGMEKIDFFWYLKKISWLALLGFVAGSGLFILMRAMF